MTTTRKGIHKGLKFISHLFVVKERDMEIGNPTDVKHVAHIGLDGSDGNAPKWMNEFRTGSGTGRPSVGSVGGDSLGGSSKGGSRDPTWTSQDFEQSLINRQINRQQSSGIYTSFPPTSIPSIPKKQPKRRKGKSSSSASSSSSSSSKSTSSTPKSNSSRSSRRKSIKSERDESGVET